ncbi:hypothetical protein MPLDJ20_150295 [Mesorhizobium plurifarium]|uniref:Uncharacterized protein n=1 Tax=Mesorhizobium plurifarium TaxID=69974 RepID=A0A090EUG7_MESPL|nr:hypothetical protein MPLDJ20_150295 [Mesorhizobium plurifarium]
MPGPILSDRRQAKVPTETLAEALDLSNLVSWPATSALVLFATGKRLASRPMGGPW